MLAMQRLGPLIKAMSQPFKLLKGEESQGSSSLWAAGKPRWESSADSAKTACSFTIRQNEFYLNPDPLGRLIGKANKSKIVVDDAKCLALINSRAQLSTIAITFAQQLGLEIHHWNKILKLEAKGVGDISYMGYVEVNLKILEIRAFIEDVLMLVIGYSPYAQRAPYS